MSVIVRKVVIGLAVLASGAAHALVIDTFDRRQTVSVTDAAPTSATNTVANAPPLTSGYQVGADRTITVNKTLGEEGFANGAYGEVIGGKLTMANGPATASLITVEWRGISGSDSDFTDSGRSTGFFLALPDAIDKRLKVSYTATGASGTSTYSRIYADGSSGNDFFAPFAEFSNPSLFTSVTFLSIEFAGIRPDGSPNQVAWDAAVDFVETTVPVPGTLALLGIGLAGLAGRIRRG